jgi:hypothetical protein
VALRRLSTSSIQTNGKSSKLWDQTTFQSGMFALATVSLTTAASQVIFDNIPADYTHLQIRMIARSASTGGSMRLDFNSDGTGTNYARQLLMGDGSSASASLANGDSVTAAIGDFPVSSSTSNTFSGYIVDILDASKTNKNKAIRSLSGHDLNGSGMIQMRSALWMSQTAITKIRIYEGAASNFAANSHFALYGIKAG